LGTAITASSARKLTGMGFSIGSLTVTTGALTHLIRAFPVAASRPVESQDADITLGGGEASEGAKRAIPCLTSV
jgi:hypothetical protein